MLDVQLSDIGREQVKSGGLRELGANSLTYQPRAAAIQL